MNWCKCGNHGPQDFAESRAVKACHVCWIQRWHPAALPPVPQPKFQKPAEQRRKEIRRVKTPCMHRTAEPIRRLKTCGGCKVYGCSIHGECTLGGTIGFRSCITCSDYATEAGEWPIRFDHTTLAPGMKGKRFNSSIIADGDGYILAYRDGWAGSEIHTIRLDSKFRPVGDPVLMGMRNPWKRIKGKRSKKWRCPGVSVGREDPRLFRHKGELHIAFIGVEPARTNQCFARLNPDRTVADAWQVNVPNRRDWEKNHSFFEHDGSLYAVYLSHPRHQIVRVECSSETIVYDEPNLFPWSGGEIRGGAPPVRVGDVYWHFFHDRITQPNGRLLYRTGLLEFDGKPPFAPLRMVREPIQVADPETQPADRNYADVLFVGGAVRVGDDWILCSGEHDRQLRLDKFSHVHLDRLLLPLPPSPMPATFAEIMAAEAWMMMLPRHQHRADRSKTLLADAGFVNITMVPGVDGFRDDWKAIAAESGWKFPENLGPGEIGCTISMLRLFQRIVDEDRPFAVIFEDDALPHPQFATLAEGWWAETPKDFDILYLGNQMSNPGDAKVSTSECFLTHALAVSRAGAKKILDLIKRGGVDKGDIMLIGYQHQKLIRHYAWSAKQAPKPEFAPQDSCWSRDTGLVYQNFGLGSSIHGEAIDFW